jgi:sugar phosphate isomerase/epimerase
MTTRLLHAHVPYDQLASNLPFFLERRLNPEVYFPCHLLDTLIPEELSALASAISAAGLATTIHAPFMDLSPGAFDPLFRAATLQRLEQVVAAAALLRPKVIVCHPGYDRWRYGEQQQTWLGYAMESFSRVLKSSEEIGCIIAVENIFEEEPSTLRALLEGVNHPRLRHCFDVGHWNLFHRVSLADWFEELGSFIAEVHIHDNHGLRDDHAPIGDGNIDFAQYFTLMARHAPDAVWTIEAHSRDRLEKALARLLPHAASR